MWHKELHLTLVIFNFIIVIASILWFIRDLDYEPFTVMIFSIMGLAALYHTNPGKGKKKLTESEKAAIKK